MLKEFKIITSQTGDTIVEVLLAIAVLSSALGIAYAISGRAQNTVQTDQERYQAQLMANSQADSLKIYMASTPGQGFTTALSKRYFCMDISYTAATNTNTIGVSPLFSSPADITTSGTGADCLKPSPVSGISYNVYIEEEPTAGSHIFWIRVAWTSLINNNNDQVELVYGT